MFGDGCEVTSTELQRLYKLTMGVGAQRGAIRKALHQLGYYPMATQVNYCQTCMQLALMGCCEGRNSKKRGKCHYFIRVAIKAPGSKAL